MDHTNYIQIKDITEFTNIKDAPEASLFYFSHDKCNVCKVLKPKIAALVEEKFPKIKLFYINTIESPEIAAQTSVFTVPVMIFTYEGREYIRKARNIGLMELEKELDKYYQMLYS